MPYYNKTAKGYNQLHGPEQIAKARIIISEIDVKGKRVLDVGAGSGVYDELFRGCKEKVNLDPSEELLKLNKTSKNVPGKAEKIPFPDNSFDVVISLTALHHTNIKGAISEMKRAAKPNAQFAFSILKKANGFEEIIKKIRANFKVKKEIDEGKDLILIC